jgi:hypothetical protein
LREQQTVPEHLCVKDLAMIRTAFAYEAVRRGIGPDRLK